MTYVSRLYGLDVASPYELGPPSRASVADVSITVADAPTDADHAVDPPGRVLASFLPSARPQYALFALAEGSLLYRFHNYADIAISSDHRELHCEFVEGAPRDVLPVILSGHVLATLLLLRGTLVLHASAVERGGRAVAFVGASGGGKSSLAAMTCLAGAKVVSDDVLRVERDGDAFVCFRGGRVLRLRPTSRSLASTVDALPQRSADGRHLLTMPPTDLEELPLHAVFVPRLVDAAETMTITPLAPKGAVLALLQYPRVQNWVDPDTAASHFAQLAALADSVPVHTIDVPWGVERGPDFFADLTDRVFAARPVDDRSDPDSP